MTDGSAAAAGQPLDLDLVHADDALLDALARGAAAASDDDVAALLAAWRADLADPAPQLADNTVPTLRAAAPVLAEPTATSAEGEPDDAAGPDQTSGPGNPTGPVGAGGPGRRHGTAWRPRRLRVAVAAAVVAALAGGTSVAAANATPGSPLWPLTQVVNPDRADQLGAESALAQARQAIAQGRRADARRLLDQAATMISRVRDPRAAARLRAELDELRALLAAVPAPPGTAADPTPTGAAATTPPTPAPGGTGGATTGGGNGGGGNGGSTGGPGQILPSLPLPLPTSIPPLLPSLLPTGLLP